MHKYFLVIIAILTTACSPTDPQPATSARPSDTATSARGAELLAPFKRDLMQALQAGLAEGPVTAIEVCQVQAPEIAAALSVDGVRIGRSSHRLRNPGNQPPDWVAPVMTAWLEADADRAPRSMSLDGNRIGYMEPIVLQPLCLTCHGSDIQADLQARIDALYPQDQATGFAVGDLRGVFWLEYPADGS